MGFRLRSWNSGAPTGRNSGDRGTAPGIPGTIVPVETDGIVPVDTDGIIPVETDVTVPVDTVVIVPVETDVTVPVDTDGIVPVDTDVTVPARSPTGMSRRCFTPRCRTGLPNAALRRLASLDGLRAGSGLGWDPGSVRGIPGAVSPRAAARGYLMPPSAVSHGSTGSGLDLDWDGISTPPKSRIRPEPLIRQTTIFTRRPGTTMTFFGVLPSMKR